MNKSYFYVFGHFFTKIGQSSEKFWYFMNQNLMNIFNLVDFQLFVVFILCPRIDDFRVDFPSKFTMEEYRGLEIQMVIFS